MAKFTSGPAIGSASGSAGGTTFSRNRFGAYIRRRAVPVNPSSAKQLIVRARLGNLSQSWRGLTAAQRLAWNTQAPSIVLTDALGQQYSPTGQQLFVSVNLNRLVVGLAQATTPPANPTQAVITSASATVVGSTGVATVTFAPAIAVGSFYLLRATSPKSAGRNYFGRSEYKDLGYLSSSDVSPYAATALYAAVFGALAAADAGKKISWELVPINSNGYPGVPVSFQTIIS